MLSNVQSVGLLMASIALAGPCWQGSVKMLSKNSPSKIEEILSLFKSCLKKMFSQELVEWLCCWWKITEQIHIDLMRKLSLSTTSFDNSVMTMALVTSINNQENFIRFSSAFAETSPECVNLIFESIKQHPKQ